MRHVSEETLAVRLLAFAIGMILILSSFADCKVDDSETYRLEHTQWNTDH